LQLIKLHFRTADNLSVDVDLEQRADVRIFTI